MVEKAIGMDFSRRRLRVERIAELDAIERFVREAKSTSETSLTKRKQRMKIVT